MYVAQGNEGVVRYRLNFTQPVSAWVPLETTVTSNAQGIVLTDTHAYVADGGPGIRTLRFLPSGSLEDLGSTFVIGSLSRLQVSGNRLLATSDDGSVFVIASLSDPDNPSVFDRDPLFSLPNPSGGSGAVVGLALSANLAYVAIDGYGLAAVDIKEPGRPVWVSGRSVEGTLGGLVPYQDRLLLAAGADGILEIPVE